MTASLDALIPVFLVILLGQALRRAGFPGEHFWPSVERISYCLFFPAPLMAGLVTATHLLAMATLPALIALLAPLG